MAETVYIRIGRDGIRNNYLAGTGNGQSIEEKCSVISEHLDEVIAKLNIAS